MKVLVYPYNYFHQPVGGGEVFLERLLNHLKPNHEIKIVCGCKEAYIYNGIECLVQGDTVDIFKGHNDLARECDIIITHLIGSSAGYNKAVQHNKPLIFIAHNNSKQYAPKYSQQDKCHVIYNSYTLRDQLFDTFGHFNGFVLHPFVPKYGVKPGNKITLINCNYNKGGEIFAEIARRLPQFEFLGVLGGYGEQIEAKLPNVTYLQNGCDMRAVYASTKILLVPSEFESFSQVAIEAMQCGIPVIANPTEGIKENLGDAGIFISRNDIEKWIENILYLMNNDTGYWRQSKICLDRAECVAEKSKVELSNFDHWLSKIK